MQKFITFPKIGQFKKTIKHVKEQTFWVGKDNQGEPIFDRTRKLPTISFGGTVKLHGTNAAVVRNLDGSFHFQSRERIITPISDNAGFAIWASTINWEKFFFPFPLGAEVAVFGEWCGGNIQKSVALNQLPKMFVIFKVMVNGTWVDFNFDWPEKQIFNIFHFPKFQLDIDFNNPSSVQNQLIEITEAVETECPVAKVFGISGIGEGVVWTAETDKSLVFKVKGEKHSVSKVKTLVPIDTEMVAAIEEFAENTVTENRLIQGLEKIPEISVKYTGDFIRWVYNDILIEEADIIVASGIETKKLGSIIATKAKSWFFERLNNG